MNIYKYSLEDFEELDFPKVEKINGNSKRLRKLSFSKNSKPKKQVKKFKKE